VVAGVDELATLFDPCQVDQQQPAHAFGCGVRGDKVHGLPACVSFHLKRLQKLATAFDLRYIPA
jgi:hypothetical protein